MGDMSKCPHGDAIGFCDTCSPNWEMDLIKADAADKIYQRGYEKGIKFILQQPNTITITAAEYAKLKEDADRLRFLIDNNLTLGTVEEETVGYRSTMPNAVRERWFEVTGWIVNGKEGATQREAIDQAIKDKK